MLSKCIFRIELQNHCVLEIWKLIKMFTNSVWRHICKISSNKSIISEEVLWEAIHMCCVWLEFCWVCLHTFVGLFTWFTRYSGKSLLITSLYMSALPAINTPPWETPAVTALYRDQYKVKQCQEYEQILKPTFDATSGVCCTAVSEWLIEYNIHAVGGSLVRPVHERVCWALRQDS